MSSVNSMLDPSSAQKVLGELRAINGKSRLQTGRVTYMKAKGPAGTKTFTDIPPRTRFVRVEPDGRT